MCAQCKYLSYFWNKEDIHNVLKINVNRSVCPVHALTSCHRNNLTAQLCLLFGLDHSHSLSLCCRGLPVLSGNTERGMPHVQWSVTVLHHYYWTQHYSSRSNVIVRLSDPGPVSAASAGPQLAVRTKTRNGAGQGSPCIFAHQQNMLSPCTQKYMSKNICQKKIQRIV